jgi:hypothetical protein
MRPIWTALALAATLGLAQPASADYYKWTDEQGQIHLTDDYYKVPPKYRAKVETKSLKPRDSDVAASPVDTGGESAGATEPTWNRPTEPTGQAEGGAWTDFSGRGSDYWTVRQRDLQTKAQDLERRLQANKESIDALSSSRAAYVGGRRQRGVIQAENERLEVELKEVRKMLASGLADEALRSGVPPDFANSLRGI